MPSYISDQETQENFNMINKIPLDDVIKEAFPKNQSIEIYK